MNTFPIKPTFIEEILLFKKMKVKANHFIKTSSTPCHLVHYIIKGSYQLMIQKRQYSVQAGQIIYYEDSEEVIWLGNEEPVEFYSMAFKSEYVQAPDILNRVQKANKKSFQLFQKIEKCIEEETAHKKFQIYNYASQLIFEIFQDQKQSYDSKEKNKWMIAEEFLQRNHLYSIKLEDLALQIKVSTATLRRDCHQKFRISPFKRMQIRRMEAAKGLLVYTPLQIKQIADQLGYNRLHEFSREFAKYFQMSPKDLRTHITSKK